LKEDEIKAKPVIDQNQNATVNKEKDLLIE